MKPDAKARARQPFDLHRHQRHVEAQRQTRGQGGRRFFQAEEWHWLALRNTPVGDDDRGMTRLEGADEGFCPVIARHKVTTERAAIMQQQPIEPWICRRGVHGTGPDSQPRYRDAYYLPIGEMRGHEARRSVRFVIGGNLLKYLDLEGVTARIRDLRQIRIFGQQRARVRPDPPDQPVDFLWRMARQSQRQVGARMLAAPLENVARQPPQARSQGRGPGRRQQSAHADNGAHDDQVDKPQKVTQSRVVERRVAKTVSKDELGQ